MWLKFDGALIILLLRSAVLRIMMSARKGEPAYKHKLKFKTQKKWGRVKR